MFTATFPLVLFFIWALDSDCAAAPRQGLDAGATLLRRETAETKSSEVSDGRASIPVTSEIRIGDIDSKLLARYGLPASSEHASTSSEKAATSFSEREQHDKFKQNAEKMHVDLQEKLLKSYISSTLWRMSKTRQTPSPTIPSWSKTSAQSVNDVMSDNHGGWVNGNGDDEFTVHGCTVDNDCDFSDCDADGAKTVKCASGNCFATNDADTTNVCAGADDGTDVNNGDAFCLGEKPTKVALQVHALISMRPWMVRLVPA